MIHRDYIIRLLEHFARALAQILLLKEQKQYTEAILEIDRTGELFFGMDFKLIKLLSDADLTGLLRSGGILDTDRCLVLADLLKVEADILMLQNKPDESMSRNVTSLSLLLEALSQREKSRIEENYSKISDLLEKTRAIEIPSHVKKKLFLYYESIGKFHKAEDILFEWSESGEKECCDEGIAFFQRLAAKSDDELISGQLPREEVTRGLDDFKKQFDRHGG
jgi:hypothetical protein